MNDRVIPLLSLQYSTRELKAKELGEDALDSRKNAAMFGGALAEFDEGYALHVQPTALSAMAGEVGAATIAAIKTAPDSLLDFNIPEPFES